MGKVERMVLYLKDNFLNGRAFADLRDLRAQGQHWLDHTANTRVHATTGVRHCDLLAAEKLTVRSSVPACQLAALKRAAGGRRELRAPIALVDILTRRPSPS